VSLSPYIDWCLIFTAGAVKLDDFSGEQWLDIFHQTLVSTRSSKKEAIAHFFLKFSEIFKDPAIFF
jgi:hypothetical protein